jgi:hypothetical protein
VFANQIEGERNHVNSGKAGLHAPGNCHCLYQLDFEGKSVQQEDSYVAAFIRQLTALGRQTPFNYKALQQFKTMGQAELADWLKIECREFSQVAVQNTPEDAAATVYRKRMELAAAYHRSVVAERAKSFLEFLVYLFSAVH